ncbi:uncharacterized protein LOC107876885, partial [Capsicum annuum]|uniref:uncharacterized protein LOC107876885 n=1 Tax=Capsicum annuum TaxID=4072 RepID=UPI001FB148A6
RRYHTFCKSSSKSIVRFFENILGHLHDASKSCSTNFIDAIFPLSYNGVEGEKNLSKSEGMEFEIQLKFLNKPAVKTIKTKYGDVYDCIDFYKQSAFDYPLLKDHNFHPKAYLYSLSILPSFCSSDSTTSMSSTIWSKDGGCPSGTVPNKRITKDDLLRQRHLPPPENVTFDFVR